MCALFVLHLHYHIVFFVGEELAPPVAPNTSIPTTIEKGQQPLALHHILASLVKGSWIDGKA